MIIINMVWQIHPYLMIRASDIISFWQASHAVLPSLPTHRASWVGDPGKRKEVHF